MSPDDLYLPSLKNLTQLKQPPLQQIFYYYTNPTISTVYSYCAGFTNQENLLYTKPSQAHGEHERSTQKRKERKKTVPSSGQTLC